MQHAVILTIQENRMSLLIIKRSRLRINHVINLMCASMNTNKDHLSSRAFFHGYAAVINHAADAQIYRKEGAAHRSDQYAIIDKRGNFVVKYRAYVDI